MTTNRYRRSDRAATVQAALRRLQRAERGLTLDEVGSLLARVVA
jgi:hypothetical protein